MLRIIAVIIELFVSLIALWILTFISTFLHELGHAIGYMIATGDRHWHIRVGWGKRLLDTKRLTVNLLVFDGLFTPSGKKIDTKSKLISTLLGGPAFSFLLVAGILFMRFSGLSFQSDFFSDSAVEWFLSYSLYSNLFILLSTLVPCQYFWGNVKGLESDGLQIIRAIKNNGD